MKNLLAVICILLLVPAIGFGQEQEREQKAPGQGYLFAAPCAAVSSGGMSGLFHFGGGGKVNLYKGFSISAKLGYLTLEFRDHIHPKHWGTHIVQGRIGINFR